MTFLTLRPAAPPIFALSLWERPALASRSSCRCQTRVRRPFFLPRGRLRLRHCHTLSLLPLPLISPTSSPHRCLIAAVAVPADAPATAAALPLLSADPPTDADADSAYPASAIALDATVPASSVVTLGRYAVPRSRRPWPLLLLTPYPAALDDSAHAPALDLRPLPTAPLSRLLLLPLPPFPPLGLLRPAGVLAPTRSQRRPIHADLNVLMRRPSSLCRSRSRCILRGRSRLRCYHCSAAAALQSATCPPQVIPSSLPCPLLNFRHCRPAARSLLLGDSHYG